MTRSEALDFLAPAVDTGCRVWADLGSGSGTFSAALAEILGAGSTVYAVDSDREAVGALRDLTLPGSAGSVVPVLGDIESLADLPALKGVQLDAALCANVLHYFPHPAPLLKAIASRLGPDGRVVVVEYDRTLSNPWVPYPIPIAQMEELASAADLTWRGVVSQWPSRYHGTLYCGVFTAGPADG